MIHTDFEKGFIAAETMSFEDFKRLGGEVQCKQAGKYRTEGKAYVVKDGDILFFKAGQLAKDVCTSALFGAALRRRLSEC